MSFRTVSECEKDNCILLLCIKEIIEVVSMFSLTLHVLNFAEGT